MKDIIWYILATIIAMFIILMLVTAIDAELNTRSSTTETVNSIHVGDVQK